MHTTISRHLSIETASRALLAAFGGDTPDWLRSEAAALEAAIAIQPLEREPQGAALLRAIAKERAAWVARQAPDGQDNATQDEEEADTVVGVLDDVLREAGDQPAPIRIVLDMTGGVLQGGSGDQACDIILIDYDEEYGTQIDIPQDSGDPIRANVAQGEAIADPAWVAKVFDAVAQGEAAFFPGIDGWDVTQQRDAMEQGWCLIQGGDGVLYIEADTDGDRFEGATMHDDAQSHVLEGARGGHGFDFAYTELCKAAVAACKASEIIIAAPAFPHDGQPVIAGQLPHETASEAQDRRARDLMAPRAGKEG